MPEVESARVVTREEWGALESKDELKPLNLPVKYIWYIYDTKSKACNTLDECVKSMRLLQKRYHQTSNLADIPFNFLIGGDGRIYEGRGWDFSAPDSREWTFTNGQRLEIGYLGKKDCIHEVNDKMEEASGDLVMMGKEKNFIKDQVRHSEFERVGIPRLPYYDDSEEEEGEEGGDPPEDNADDIPPDAFDHIPPPEDYEIPPEYH